MPPLEIIVGGVLIIALTIYALSGGADFGGGVWDLFAHGPRAQAQRLLIANAIGPIWEADNVWLVLVVVVLFTAFPPAYAAISTALFVPLTIMLVGVVLRGAAFAFRAHDHQRDDVQRRWSRVFAIGSIVTPIMLGVCLGTLASGAIRLDPGGLVTTGFFSAWLSPFAWAVGLLALALFAFVAALYLVVEAATPELRGDFRRRALAAALATDLLAGLVFLLARDGAPRIALGLSGRVWALPLLVVTGLAAVGTLWALWANRFLLARALGVGQAVLILWGWAAAQYPYIVPPDLTLQSAAAPPVTLRLLLIALILGALVLFPSFFYLYRVFKGPAAFALVEAEPEETRS
jgi:cytochrome d ubiquinol oxidase subunit II